MLVEVSRLRDWFAGFNVMYFGGALPDGTFRVRLAGSEGTYDVNDAACGLPEDVRLTIAAVRDNYAYLLAK